MEQLLFGLLAADCRRDEGTLGTLERAQHDLDRKHAAVLAPSDELDPGADLLRQGIGRRAQVVGDQPFGETFGNDVRDLLAYEFVALVTELLFRLEVQQDDAACRVHHHHRVRSGFEQAAVARLHLRQMLLHGLANADIPVDLQNRADRAIHASLH